jgi:regulatory protein
MDQSRIKKRLMNKAVHYLGRYATSQHRLGQVLARFATRKLADADEADIEAAIAETIAQCAEFGYVQDDVYARSQARSQRNQGRSARVIRQRLRQHAIDHDAINAAIDEADEHVEDGELLAAFRFARRRRLGVFATAASALDSQILRNRHLGSLARAGFSMAICQQVLTVADRDEAEALMDALVDSTQDTDQ